MIAGCTARVWIPIPSSLCQETPVRADTFAPNRGGYWPGFPKVWVHRDFHARNLFLYANELVMIDFQDAVLGPWTYDLASLLWDRYWDWGRERRELWIETYRNRLQGRGFPVPNAQLFRKQTELLALQRNLKILGIFCRLAYRDGKREYLQFLPRFWTYLWDLLAGLPDGHVLQQVFAPWAPDSRP